MSLLTIWNINYYSRFDYKIDDNLSSKLGVFNIESGCSSCNLSSGYLFANEEQNNWRKIMLSKLVKFLFIRCILRLLCPPGQSNHAKGVVISRTPNGTKGPSRDRRTGVSTLVSLARPIGTIMLRLTPSTVLTDYVRC